MFKKEQKLVFYLLVLLIPFLLLLLRPKSFTSFKLNFVSASALPIQIISFPFREVKKMVFYHHTYSQYQKLKKEYQALKARLVGLEEVVIESKRFEKLLEFKSNLVFSSTAARVIGRDPSSWNAAVIIDKGERDDLKIGLPVVNALGVVGKISEVSKNVSKVILLNDPSFSVAAIAQRSREGGLISGTLQGICRMRYLSSDADIQEGDIIVTSKLSSAFPEGLLIGTVMKVEKSKSSPGIECLVVPAVTPSKIEEVIIIKK